MPIDSGNAFDVGALWFTGLVTFLVFIAVAFLFFLVMREVMTWYFKINLLLREQQETNRLLRQLVDQGHRFPPATLQYAAPPMDPRVIQPLPDPPVVPLA